MEERLSPFSFVPKVRLWVDAQDSDGTWRLARIKEIFNPDAVLVSFDGRSRRYDKICYLSNSTFTPLRLHTRGYTGQQRITTREYELQPSQVKLMEQKMTLLRRTEFRVFSAYELTLFVRGDLFVLVDDLLTKVYLVVCDVNVESKGGT